MHHEEEILCFCYYTEFISSQRYVNIRGLPTRILIAKDINLQEVLSLRSSFVHCKWEVDFLDPNVFGLLPINEISI